MLPVAFSPCPNDTFLFYAWARGIVGGDLPISPTLLDIETLNNQSLTNKFPLIKISCAHYKKIQEAYVLLPVGATLGYGAGPKIIAKTAYTTWEDKRVAIPGKETTAHALFSYFFPRCQNKVFCTYDEVLDYVTMGKAEVGVIIHETRFTYQQKGFCELVDLGKLWEERFSLPLPLGALAAHRSLNLPKITHILQDSLDYAHQNRAEALQWSLHYAQEKEAEVVRKHVDLYVTTETKELTTVGQKAVAQLLACV